MIARLQKIMSQAGIASRRKCEDLIEQGRVVVNGKIATIGQSADSETDKIMVDGFLLGSEKKVYIALYKPKGYVTTVQDRFAKRKVSDLVHVNERVYPVGRLDSDTEGLLFMTNDGDFANMVMHPRYEVEKVYEARLQMPLGEGDVGALLEGIFIEGKRSAANNVKILTGSRTVVELTIHEGRHKIVKRMFKAVGNYVKELTRTRVGPITIAGLKKGAWRYLTPKEVDSLSAAGNLPSSSKPKVDYNKSLATRDSTTYPNKKQGEMLGEKTVAPAQSISKRIRERLSAEKSSGYDSRKPKRAPERRRAPPRNQDDTDFRKKVNHYKAEEKANLYKKNRSDDRNFRPSYRSETPTGTKAAYRREPKDGVRKVFPENNKKSEGMGNRDAPKSFEEFLASRKSKRRNSRNDKR